MLSSGSTWTLPCSCAMWLGGVSWAPWASASSSECSSGCLWGWQPRAGHGTRHIGGLWGWWPLLCSASRATELGSDGGMLIPIICWGHQQHHSFTPLWQVKQAPLRGKRQPRQRGSDNRHRSSLAQTKPWQWMRSGYAKPHEITFLYLTSGPMWSIFKFRPHSSTGLLIS